MLFQVRYQLLAERPQLEHVLKFGEKIGVGRSNTLSRFESPQVMKLFVPIEAPNDPFRPILDDIRALSVAKSPWGNQISSSRSGLAGVRGGVMGCYNGDLCSI